MRCYLVTYSTKNGIVSKVVKNIKDLQVGSITGYGHEVIDIQIYYKERFYSLNTYYQMRTKEEEVKYKVNKKYDYFLKIIDFICDILN